MRASLDYGRRASEDPGSLYPRRVVELPAPLLRRDRRGGRQVGPRLPGLADPGFRARPRARVHAALPVPTGLDEATARAFYGFTQDVQRRSGGPLLVSRPDLVCFLAGQQAEVFPSTPRAAPGARRPRTTEGT
jgi:hypothetical protein